MRAGIKKGKRGRYSVEVLERDASVKNVTVMLRTLFQC